MAENKTIATNASVDEFIKNIDNDKRREDAKISLELYKEITNEKAVMWGPSIIGFGVQHYEYESGRKGTMPAAGFSPRKANMTFYIGNKFKDADHLFKKLGKYKKSVACLYINKLADVDLKVLKNIVENDYKWALKRLKK